jgi:signal transduction histidine kinase/ActR/RegA family two-component response regulator
VTNAARDEPRRFRSAPLVEPLLDPAGLDYRTPGLSTRAPHSSPWLEVAGEAAELVRAVDWSKTPLGPIATWPLSLKTTVATLLRSRHPMFLWWGTELTQIYNDAYIPSFGRGKHPAAMGQAGTECWGEIWPIISPQIDDVMTRGKASWNEDHLVPVWRNGRIEEVYWTYGYSPVLDDSGAVGGTLVVCTETTRRVLAERRLGALRALAQATAPATTTDEILAAASRVLAESQSDVPFVVLYARDEATGHPARIHSEGLNEEQLAAVDRVCRPILAATDAPVDLAPEIVGASLPGGPWPEPSTSALIVELRDGYAAHPSGYLVFGLSPRLPFDASYRSHLARLAEHMALGLGRVESHRARESTTVKARQAAERAQHDRESLLRDLETANRAKDEFLAMLGHELRNPLSPIVTALDLIKRREQGRPSNREHEIIDRQVAHLVRLVDDLLDVSKITRGKIALRREPVEIAEVVAKAVEIASDLFEKRRHTLRIDVPPTGHRVDGDPVRLAQVVANLLTNAARYTEPGGAVSVRAAHEASGNVVLTVEDNGVGIAPEILPRVFELFVQGQRSTDRKEGGLGLGLALAKSLVAMHGGTLVARSEGAGRGSAFEIRLASTSMPAKTREGSRAPSPLPHARTKRVLIVDDSVDGAEMLQELISMAGHETAIAHDGPSALAIAERFLPDVAVLDIGLPVMDGYELAKRLRENPHTAHCRLIALTGYGQEADRAQSKAAGFYAHIVKPVETERLMGVIAEEPRADSVPP